MKILGLYNNACAVELFTWLKEQDHEVILCKERLDPIWCKEEQFDLTVSYTYRFILSSEVIEALGNNIVNIHNSYLPWNRGADPNLWSIAENTPRGVTLHYIDEGLDKGYIIAQEFVNDGEDETLASSYNNLDYTAKCLFKKAFRYYKYWPSLKKSCHGKGSYHSLDNGKQMKMNIEDYEMTVHEFKESINNILGGV